MTMQTAVCAVMANAAYAGKKGEGEGKYSQDRIQKSIADSAAKYKGDIQKEIMKYEVVQSDQNMFVAVNKQDKTVIIAYKGTSRFGPDISHDVVNVATGHHITKLTSSIAKFAKIPHRFNTALNVAKNTSEKFPGYKVVLTGHSLGGTLAEHVAMKNPQFHCETFNAGSTPVNSLIKLVFGGKQYQNIK